MGKDILILIGCLAALVVIAIGGTVIGLGLDWFAKPVEAKIERRTIEQSRSFVESQNQQIGAYLAEAAKAQGPQRVALLAQACNIRNSMADGTTSSANSATIAALGGCP